MKTKTMFKLLFAFLLGSLSVGLGAHLIVHPFAGFWAGFYWSWTIIGFLVSLVIVSGLMAEAGF